MDYFAPYNRALENAGAISDNGLAQAYKLHDFETKQRAAKLEYEAKKLAYDDVRRKHELETKAREAATSARPTPNPEFAAYQAGMQGPPVIPQTEGYAALQQNVQANPQFAAMTGSDKRLAEMPQYDMSKAQYPAQGVAAPPEMNPVNKIKVYLDTVAAQDPAMALEMKSKLYEEFKKVVPPGISADAALAKFNEYFGENNVAAQTKKDLMAVNRNQVVIDPNTGKTVFDNTQDPTQFGQVEYMTLKNGKEIAFVRDENGKPQVIGQDAPRVSVSVGGGAGDKTDQIVARAAVADLPKLRRDARSAEQVKPRIDQMVKLLDSGAGGIKGNSLAAISGIFDTPATSEAELFKKLASAGAGQLRASVIGPGPVSNYEQSLLQSVSGGGNGARTAIRALLKYYASEAQKTIDNYNDAVDSATTVAPKAERGFGKIGQGRPQPPAGRKSTSDPMGIR